MLKSALLLKVNRLAPVVAAILLVALIASGGIDAHRHAGMDEYLAEVRLAIESVPHRIGPAVGTDVEPTPAAVRLLAPNKILQRRYLDPLTGSSKSLLIVHCSDIRDMLGHYPPVCYPAHGWRAGPKRSMPVDVGGRSAIAMMYEFMRMDDLVESRMTVMNFFILPGNNGQVAPDMESMARLARTQQAAGLGVAQIQIVLDGTPSDSERENAARQVLGVLGPVVEAIGRGVER
jgi:hypothetical protein